MTRVVYFLIILMNVACLAVRKRSRLVTLITIIGAVLIMGGNNLNADYSGYDYYYRHQTYPASMEWGYVWLSMLASGAGLSYLTFFLLLVTAGVAAMYFLAIRLSKNVHLFSVCYFLTMLPLDVVQVRQFIAFVIMAYALLFHCRGRKLLFCLMILLGTLFQISTIVYLPMVLLNAERVSNKKFVKIFFIAILVLCVFVFINGNRIGFIGDLMSRYISDDKMVYFGTRTRFGFMKYFPFQFGMIYMAWLTEKYFTKQGRTDKIALYAQTIYVCVVYSSISMPLIMLNNNFSRFFKFALIALLICLSRIYTEMANRRGGQKLKIPIIRGKVAGRSVLLMLCFAVVVAYHILMQTDSVVNDVLSNNMFF